MKRIVKQATIFLSLLLVVSLIRLPYGSYRERMLPKLKAFGKKVGLLSLDTSDILLGFPATVTAKEMSVLFAAGKVPLPLLIDSAIVEPYLAPLFMLHGKVHGIVNLYQGSVDIVAQRGLFGAGGDIVANGKNIDLSAHPLFQALGAHGELSFAFHAQSAQDVAVLTDLDAAELHAQVSRADLVNGVQMFGLVTIPPIGQIEAKVDAQLQKGRFVLSNANVKSSLGTLTGSGAGNLDAAGRATSGSASFSANLTPEGSNSVGQYLALAAGIQPSNQLPPNWRIEVEFKLPNPRVTVRPAG